ncbi:MAG TPA: hypothetical protein VF719_00120 [Abditibacteriaceae bacterium]
MATKIHVSPAQPVKPSNKKQLPLKPSGNASTVKPMIDITVPAGNALR